MTKGIRLAGVAAVFALAFGLIAQGVAQAPRAPAAVDQQRLENADRDPGQWMSHGRDWTEQRYSPLTQINDTNANRLGLAWYADLNTYRGVVATPLVIDGVLYNVSAWSIVTAYDAATGKPLWTYDPKVPVEFARIACCGTVSRGLAAWKGRIYLGSLDGRLIAIDAKSGQPVWSTDTKDKGQPLSITGAPRIADGQVVIGNAGGDFGARGYVSAYDADTGKQTWKFYIVPGDPRTPDGAASDSAMPLALKTWNGQWWKYGGGGNAWDGLAYDPKLHLVYFATGNGSPHPSKFRGGGDNLFLCSIVAVDAKTGHYRWHYQEIPAEEWDYDCTAPMILADLKIDGRQRQVLMHTPKNGFFYVMDRTSGKLISAKSTIPNLWASGVDIKTGRPMILPSAYPQVKPSLITPGYGGGHNWNPMSFSPKTGLAYFPTMEGYAVQSVAEDQDFKFELGRTTLNAGSKNEPDLRRQLAAEGQRREKGYMLAWDPVRQKEAFRIAYPHAGSGGTMVTAGNLLVQGTIGKTFAVYRADNGAKLFEMPIGSVPVSGAVTYMAGGRQYIAINAGWNSAIVAGLDEGGVPFSFAPARLLVFALDAKGVTLPPAPPDTSIPSPPNTPVTNEQRAAGAEVFARNCQTCHGANAVGGQKDLRHMTKDAHAEFFDIVLAGKRAALGMPNFKDVLTREQAEAVHNYLIARAQEDWQPSFTRPQR